MEPNFYTETATVLNADADFRSLLKPSALLRYVEQVSADHARAFGMDDKFFQDHNVAFLGGKQALQFARVPRRTEALTLTTRAERSRRGAIKRITTVTDAAGKLVATVDCRWILVDLTGGHIMREPDWTVENFWKNGILDPDSNVQFGEGGAGTFSDGKLNTLVKDTFGRGKEVLSRFVEAGAPSEILYQQKPHLGTDQLVGIVQFMRHQIEEMGGEFRFRSTVTDLMIRDRKLNAVIVNAKEEIPAEICILAPGHSARDTFAMLEKHNINMEPKSFAVGVRVEHPQTMINQDLYGEPENDRLGASSYKVTHTLENGRGVYSFCMCPGGYVVNASSEEGMLAVNGMSYQARDSHNANSAIIVTVNPSDFPEEGVLGGIALQRKLERAAWEAGKGKIPVQLFKDYCTHQKSTRLGDVIPCIKGAYTLTDVRSIFPKEIGDSIEAGIHAFGKKLSGFDRPDALLEGVESRTSSPVRIVREPKKLTSNIEGIYPCGEGAGYAGGITSAAMDGIKVAEAVASVYALPVNKM